MALLNLLLKRASTALLKLTRKQTQPQPKPYAELQKVPGGYTHSLDMTWGKCPECDTECEASGEPPQRLYCTCGKQFLACYEYMM